MKIIIDTYGADAGTAPIIQGAIEALHSLPELTVTLIGNQEDIMAQITEAALTTDDGLTAAPILDRIEIIHTTDFITNHEAPTAIFTGRDNSSNALSLKLLKEDKNAIGLLTAGSTGATLVGSIFRLGLHKGLKSPALSALLPQVTGNYACLTDCGANIDCTAKDLLNFATLSSDYMKQLYKIEAPRVALLNVGKEDGKGNPLALEVTALLKESGLNFVGNIEGCDISLNKADVIVTDGFTGNIVLKEVEATGKIAMRILENTAKESCMTEDATVKSALAEMYTMFEMNTRGGATFLGTNKPIIKMHGVATKETVVACAKQLLQLHM